MTRARLAFACALAAFPIEALAADPSPQKDPITTHVLDTSLGKPAAGVAVALQRRSGKLWEEVGESRTNADGRDEDRAGERDRRALPRAAPPRPIRLWHVSRQLAARSASPPPRLHSRSPRPRAPTRSRCSRRLASRDRSTRSCTSSRRAVPIACASPTARAPLSRAKPRRARRRRSSSRRTPAGSITSRRAGASSAVRA